MSATIAGIIARAEVVKCRPETNEVFVQPTHGRDRQRVWVSCFFDVDPGTRGTIINGEDETLEFEPDTK